MKRMKQILGGLIIILLVTSPVWAAEGEGSACVAPDQLEKTIAPEAELETFACLFKEWKGNETLHFKVVIKNVSDKAQRFRVNIFLDNGKAVGGLIPRKTKKGLIEPGKTGSFVYPVKGMQNTPKSLMLKISTMGL